MTLTTVEVLANVWTDSNGSTHHRVYLTLNNRHNEQAVSAVTYGYGSHYLNTAGDMLAAAGLAPEGTTGYRAMRAIKAGGADVTHGSTRVTRKKDL